MLKRILPVLLSLVIVFALITPIQTAQAAEVCMVRVNLGSLGMPGTVTVQVNGSFSIPNRPDLVFESGRDYSISNSGNGLTINGSGISASMGSSFTVKSNQSTSSYFYVRDVSRSYLGDMTFIASSGGVQLINRVFIEDYVYGVLRGELNNSYPLETLKAQAVAARTYVYKRIKTTGTYDIGDTSADQVYRGYSSSDTTIGQAVNETKGLIVYYGNNVIDTYYSASNGGQIETIKNKWPERATGPYSAMKEDPYDVRNPSSPLDSIRLSKNGGIANYALEQLLRQRMGGFYGAIAGIQSITLSDPRKLTSGTESSRYYLTMTFNLLIGSDGGYYSSDSSSSGGSLGGGALGGGDGSSSSGTGGATTPYTGTTTLRSVSINTQTDLISIISPSYKLSLFTVVESSDGFTIEARRYGHGVGLSQRGAQQMGKEGIDFRTIISFYYDGTNLVDRQLEREASGNWDTTAPTTPVTPGVSIGTGVVNASSLNVRSSASSSASKIGALGSNASVNIMAVSGDFYAIVYGASVGYVAKSYITANLTGNTDGTTATPPPSTVVPTLQTGTIALSSATSSLNLRSGASTANGIVTVLKSGAKVQVTGTSADWTAIQVVGSNYTGYVMSKYIVLDAVVIPPTVDQTVTPTPTVPTVTQNPNTGLGGQLGGSNTAVGGQLGGGSLGGATTPSPTPVWDITTSPATPTPTVNNTTSTGTGMIKASNGNVTMRSDANTSSSPVALLGNNVATVVLGKAGDWYKVTINSLTGWVHKDYITVTGTVPDLSGTVVNTPSAITASGKIVLSSASSSLNIRSGPGTTYGSVGYIGHGASVTVGAVSGEWVAITYNGVQGYVMSRYVSTAATGGNTTPAIPSTTTTIKLSTATSTMNVRSGPGTTYAVITSVKHGTAVTAGAVNGEWTNITIGNASGYVMTKYLGSGTTGTVTPPAATSKTMTTTGSVHLRQKADKTSTSMGVISAGSTVTVVSAGTTFTKVTVNGKTGYISNTYLK